MPLLHNSYKQHYIPYGYLQWNQYHFFNASIHGEAAHYHLGSRVTN